MPDKSVREKHIVAALVASLLCAQFGVASASEDWVEEGVTEFHLPRPREVEAKPPADHDSFPRRQAKPGQQQGNGGDPSEFVPPADAVIKNVTDNGGIELGPDGKPRKTRVPLEAGVSTWRQRLTGGTGSGFDQRAVRLLEQAPRLATPKTISADPKAFKAWLNETHPGVLEKMSKEQIVEIKGEWDDAAHALRTFGLPHTRVSVKKFAELNLAATKIVVVNCEGHLPPEAITRLRTFVGMGGSLLTTDWALQNVVEKAFPHTIRWFKGYYTDSTRSHIVDAVVVGEDPELLKGVPPIGHWQLVKKSQIVRIVKAENVSVLARTRMMSEDPAGLGILAVTFTYGAGRVLHLVGHFDNNSELAFNTAIPDPAPGLGLSLRQAIAANFVAEALKQHQDRSENQAKSQ